ncbi:DUF924 family protein [Fundicoccus culcitae]|uniref:DUF924 domain-containing protein n=1 Tax=Fundicoccus culcitae TaxID=2969821 RepID=A0ABY5P4J6_9LACT|nr:DUF924 family protein [Fundicoccus culcitae]UUX33619.1 DUF924 domain-containing protein [Fundicoccus culcitae]
MSIHPSVEVLTFWFAPEHKELQFARNDAFDAQIRDKFYDTWVAAKQGELANWRTTIQGRLAEIIVLDQFSRNLNRNSALAYAQDTLALVLSQELLRQPDYHLLSQAEQQFALLPFMHSESAVIHAEGLPLFEELGNDVTTEFAIAHKAIIDRFGRYPHRNATLGRTSTPEEEAFLAEDDSSSKW